MNNIENIQSMTAEELAKFFSEHSMCDLCACEMDEYSCMATGCEEGIYKWLTGERKEKEAWVKRVLKKFLNIMQTLH